MEKQRKGSAITKPVLSPRKVRELLEMSGMLHRFEDELLGKLLDLPEGPDRNAKEKRLSIARAVRAGLEWALGIEGKELDQDVIGPEWADWCVAYKRDLR